MPMAANSWLLHVLSSYRTSQLQAHDAAAIVMGNLKGPLARRLMQPHPRELELNIMVGFAFAVIRY